MPPRRIQPPYLVPHNAAAAPGPQFAPAPALPDSLEGQRMSFQGRIDSVREIAALLKTIAFKPKCIVTASRAGLLFTVDDARCAKACAYFPVKHFRRYRFNDGTGAPLDQQTEAEANENDPGPELRFEVNLYNLMESMNVYGTAMVGSGGLVAAAAAAADGSGSGTGRNSGAHERNPNSAANKSTVLDIWYEPVEKKLVLTWVVKVTGCTWAVQFVPLNLSPPSSLRSAPFLLSQPGRHQRQDPRQTQHLRPRPRAW